jgi:hypothetical protein
MTDIPTAELVSTHEASPPPFRVRYAVLFMCKARDGSWHELIRVPPAGFSEEKQLAECQRMTPGRTARIVRIPPEES